jgi:acetolactate decarboxylase
VKTRRVGRQEKPYVRLTERRRIRNFSNVFVWKEHFRILDALLLEGRGVPGFHFHFITQDHQAGGHLIDCIVENMNCGDRLQIWV